MDLKKNYDKLDHTKKEEKNYIFRDWQRKREIPWTSDQGGKRVRVSNAKMRAGQSKELLPDLTELETRGEKKPGITSRNGTSHRSSAKMGGQGRPSRCHPKFGASEEGMPGSGKEGRTWQNPREEGVTRGHKVHVPFGPKRSERSI